MVSWTILGSTVSLVMLLVVIGVVKCRKRDEVSEEREVEVEGTNLLFNQNVFIVDGRDDKRHSWVYEHYEESALK